MSSTEALAASITPASQRKLLRAGVPLAFAYLGCIFSSWSSRMAYFSEHLDIDTARLSWILLCGGVGAVLAFPLSTWLNRHVSLRTSFRGSIGVLLAVLPLIGCVQNRNQLYPLALLLGLGMGVFDVVVNVLGGAVEKKAGRSVMSMLHAWFCVGTVGGALIGSATIHLDWSALAHYLFVSAVFAVPVFWMSYDVPAPAASTASRVTGEEAKDAGNGITWPRGPVVLLAALGFMAALIEGSISDWSGLYLREVLHADISMTPIAYGAFAAATLILRITGDRLKDRFGAIRVMTTGAIIGALGLTLTLLTPLVGVAILGFAITGAGMAMAFPFVYSAAARESPVAMAGVATIAYSGGLIGPPVIGHIAHAYDLSVGIALMVVICLVIAAITPRAKML